MTLTGVDGAKFLEKEGAQRIVTSRELSMAEVKKIADETELEIESFVHGALCYCYSGQCLMSSFIGGRSGNRGACAQPCRLKYSIDGKSGYLLSPKDMGLIKHLDKLKKIEAFQACPIAESVTPELIKTLHDNRLECRAWGVFDTDIMKRTCDAGVDGGMTVNFPDKLIEYRNK